MAIRWGNDGSFIFLGSKITADGDCSHEIKRCLLLGKTTMTNLDSILKSQRYCFANKGPSSQSGGFSSSHIWMWELGHKEGWAPKNWCFWTVVLRRLKSLGLQDQTSKSYRKSILNVHWRDWCWSWKLQYFGHLMEKLTHLKRPWCWERLGAGGERDDRGWDGWMASPTQWTWVWMNSGSWRWTGRPGVLQFMGSQRVGHDWATELNWLKTALFSIGHFWGVPTPPNSLLLGMPWHFQPHCEHWTE